MSYVSWLPVILSKAQLIDIQFSSQFKSQSIGRAEKTENEIRIGREMSSFHKLSSLLKNVNMLNRSLQAPKLQMERIIFPKLMKFNE